METVNSIAVVGGGSWSTAIVKMLMENTSSINWWVRNKDSVNYIKENKRNPKYLTGVEAALINGFNFYQSRQIIFIPTRDK